MASFFVSLVLGAFGAAHAAVSLTCSSNHDTWHASLTPAVLLRGCGMTQGVFKPIVDAFSCFLVHIPLPSHYETAKPFRWE